jgi:glutamate-5-semialdehyde dehydrogenase
MADQTIQDSIYKVRQSASRLAGSSAEERNALLSSIAKGLRTHWDSIRMANERDLAEARERGEKEALVKRLLFDEEKRDGTIEGIVQVMSLADPVGNVLERRLLDTGLTLERVSVPIGVIGMVFEARPDALVQIVSLCLKSGNGIVLKGGKEAANTNAALVSAIMESAASSPLGSDWLLLLTSHADVDVMLKMDTAMDLLIPRGSNAFVRYVMDHTSIPVLGHAAGICHMYIDKDADMQMAVECAFDAKTQYPAACNAVETLLVHREIAPRFLPLLARRLETKHVLIHGDATTHSLIDCVPYAEGDWDKEYLAQELNIRVVDDYGQATEHIAAHGSHHTDAIVTENNALAERFLREVDSADVFVNCSTRFADGFRFGLGAEVGISTSKIHARGPVGLSGLMSSKWLLRGAGHTVSSYSGPAGKKFIHRELPVGKGER